MFADMDLYEYGLPKYHVQKQIDVVATLLKHPLFQLDSTRPIPTIDRLICKTINYIHDIRINRTRIKSIKYLYVRDGLNFDKLPTQNYEPGAW